jgi:AcrR family transcriptional regulator
MAKKLTKPSQRKPIQRRSQETRDAILKASTQILLSKAGLSGLNSNAIAVKAGVSIGSFYQYYANKEAVLSDLIQNRLNHLFMTMSGAFADEGMKAKKNPREFLYQLMVALLQEFKKDQLLALLMFQYSHVIADQNRMEKIDEQMIPVIVQAIKNSVPQVRKKNLELAVFVMLQSYRGIVAIASARRFKGVVIEELAEEVTDLFWRYLSADMLG